MATKDNKVALTFYYDWLELLEDFSDEEIGRLTIAAVIYDMTGKEPAFDNKMMKLAFKAIKNSIDINQKNSKERSAKSQKAAEARWNNENATASNEMPEHKQECPSINENATASNEMPEHPRDAYKTIQDNTIQDADADVTRTMPEHQQPLPERSEYEFGIIKDVWNASMVTRSIENIPLFGTRANNTRLCIGNNFGSFVELIKDLENHYFFQQMAKQGRPIDYDWFVNPDHYLAIREGKYKEKHKSNQTWIEGVWTEDGLELGS